MKMFKWIRQFLKPIKKHIEFTTFSIKWRRINKHNNTWPGNVFPVDKVTVGNYSYGLLTVNTYGNKEELLKIGSFCSIALEVVFILGGEHPYKGLTTFPIKYYILHNNVFESKTKGSIIVEDGVWIGEQSIVLSGVTIGKGAIIGAGSIVSHDIPPFAIYAGGRVKKYRFSEEVIKKLLKFDLNSLSIETIDCNLEFIYNNITPENVDEIISRLTMNKGL